MKTHFLTLLFLFFCPLIFSQNNEYKVVAKIDSTHILIGDHLNVKLSVTTPLHAKVLMPKYNEQSFDSLGIDYVSTSSIDTANSTQSIYTQRITVTAFDSGEYVFPTVVIYSIDSQILAVTQPIPFSASSIAVDTTQAFRDIKQPVKVPLTFREIIPYLLLGLALAIVVALTIFLVKKFYRKKTPEKIVRKNKPKVKPHITALNALEKLRLKHLWQDGQIKAYYSEMTDILREYLDGRWNIDAPEMTSSEIMEALVKVDIDLSLKNDLKEIFTTADLVKFAKSEPLPDEHDTCFKNSVNFVKKTMEVAENDTTKKSQK